MGIPVRFDEKLLFKRIKLLNKKLKLKLKLNPYIDNNLIKSQNNDDIKKNKQSEKRYKIITNTQKKACPLCLFDNESTAMKCEMCGNIIHFAPSKKILM